MPLQASMIDMQSMTDFLEFMGSTDEDLKETYGKGYDWDFVRILLNRFDKRVEGQSRILAVLRSVAGAIMMEAPLVDSNAFSKAMSEHKTLFEYAPTSDSASYERAMESLTAITRAIEVDILTAWGREISEALLEAAAA
jgi:cellulose biosynthesis protein BcsQ